MMAAHCPENAPMMAAMAEHLRQTRQYAMGTTALPISTPISRYTYLRSTTTGKFN